MERKEAIEVIRKNWPDASFTQLREALETLIPELKENEDEKIRKYIVELLKDVEEDENYTGRQHIPNMIAYLEKLKEPRHAIRVTKGFGDPDGPQFELVDLQKEQTPILEVFGFKVGDAVRLKDGDGRKHIIKSFEEVEGIHGPNFFHVEFEDNSARVSIYPDKEYPNGYYTQMEKFEEEQKPAEWSEDYREEDLRTRFAFYTYKDEDDVLYLSNVFVEETSRNKGFGTKILAAAEKVAETLGVIIIRLKVRQNSSANAWYRKHGYGFMAFEDDYDWLEKTLEYMKPVKQARSEEDEKFFRLLHAGLYAMKVKIGRDEYDKAVERLKSLRPQPRWKPSEEQMRFLLAVINEPNNAGSESCHIILNSLYHDLQNLH